MEPTHTAHTTPILIMGAQPVLLAILIVLTQVSQMLLLVPIIPTARTIFMDRALSMGLVIITP